MHVIYDEKRNPDGLFEKDKARGVIGERCYIFLVISYIFLKPNKLFLNHIYIFLNGGYICLGLINC